MNSEKQRETLAVTETIIESVSRLVHELDGGAPGSNPSLAVKHKVASALAKKLSIYLPKPE